MKHTSHSTLLICCIALFVLTARSLSGQSFIHQYRNNTANQLYFAIDPLSDGRIAVGGSYTLGVDQAIMAMLDSSGNILWNRIYGNNDFAWAVTDISDTPSGELFALLTATNSPTTTSHLARISPQNGQLLNSIRFGDLSRYGTFFDIELAADGLILAGGVGSAGFSTGYSLVKTDFNGNVIWQRTVSLPGQRGVFTAATVSPGGDIWAVTSLETDLGAAAGRIGLFQYDSDGNLLAEYECRATDPVWLLGLNSIDWQPGVGPVVGGFYYNFGPSNIRPLFIQFDTTGTLVWSKILNSDLSAYQTAYIHHLQDGNLLAACGSGGAPNLGVMVKLDSDGSAIWTRDQTTNAGVESLLASSLGDDGKLYNTGIYFTPLPALERNGFVTKTDDPLFDKPSCCSRAVEWQTLDVALEVTPIAATAASDFDIEPDVIPQLVTNTQRFTVCAPEAGPSFALSDSTICPGQCVTLRLAPTASGTYSLFIPGAEPETIQLTDSAIVCFPQEGIYTIQLEGDNCQRSGGTVEIKQRVPGMFSLPDTLICPGLCITPLISNLPTDEVYNWSFEGGQPDTAAGLQPPEVCFDSAGTYALRLYIGGCGFSAQKLTVTSTPYQIPNAFTPNGDGSNDVFRPLLECPNGDFSFQVYNRWGQKVFSTTDPAAGWDGRFNNVSAPSDVYVWILDFGETDANGQLLSRKEKGEVTLIR